MEVGRRREEGRVVEQEQAARGTIKLYLNQGSARERKNLNENNKPVGVVVEWEE